MVLILPSWLPYKESRGLHGLSTPFRTGDNHFSLCSSSSSHWLCVLAGRKSSSMSSPGRSTAVLPEIQQTLTRCHWSETAPQQHYLGMGLHHSQQPVPLGTSCFPLRTTCFKEQMAFLALRRLWADSCSGLVPGKSVFAACSSFTGIDGSVKGQAGWDWFVGGIPAYDKGVGTG